MSFADLAFEMTLFHRPDKNLLARLDKKLKDLLLHDSRYKSERFQALPWSYIKSPEFWTHVKKARRFAGSLDRENLSSVHVFAASRGGSHVFTSQFHFFDVCFAFWGKFYSHLGRRSPLVDHPASLHYTDFLLRSVFGGHGLQNKRGDDISVLVYCHNKERRIGSYKSAISADRSAYKQKQFIFYFRNPLRIVQSTYLKAKAGELTAYTNEDFEREIKQESLRLRAALELRERFSNIQILFHEVFCANFDRSLTTLSSFLSAVSGRCASYHVPSEFFTECFPFGDRPVVRDGYLCSPQTRERIAAGGLFNPLITPNSDRTMRSDLRDFVDKGRLALARNYLTESALDFWLNDSAVTYAGMSDQEILDLVT